MLSVTDVDSAEGIVVVLFSETTACVFEQLTIIIASMPSRAVKDKQGITEYIPYANPITKEASDAVRNCLVNAYNETVQAQAELDGLLNSDFEEIPDEDSSFEQSM